MRGQRGRVLVCGESVRDYERGERLSVNGRAWESVWENV